jgi:hypothetical protein
MMELMYTLLFLCVMFGMNIVKAAGLAMVH